MGSLYPINPQYHPEQKDQFIFSFGVEGIVVFHAYLFYDMLTKIHFFIVIIVLALPLLIALLNANSKQIEQPNVLILSSDTLIDKYACHYCTPRCSIILTVRPN